jgi:hypothetical protein
VVSAMTDDKAPPPEAPPRAQSPNSAEIFSAKPLPSGFRAVARYDPKAFAEDYVRTCPVEDLFALLWLAEGRLNPGGGGE